MSEITLSLPFGLPPPELADALLRELDAPALAALLSFAQVRPSTDEVAEGWVNALPHETWLARLCGLPVVDPANSSPPVAGAAMRALGIEAHDGYWFVLNPGHIELGRASIALRDPRSLQLNEDESRALFAALEPLCAETGNTLLYGDPQTWFLRADDWQGLETATVDAALGDTLAPVLPRGEHARAWRRLQNEAQMLWFTHPVNTAREERALPVINTLWLSGGAPAVVGGTAAFTALFEPGDQPSALACLGAMNGGVHYRGDAYIAVLVEKQASHSLLVLDKLSAAALAQDWGTWLLEMRALDRACFAPLLDALRHGWVRRLNLGLFARDRGLELSVGRLALHKFWVRPSLSRLAA
ncbi:MAG TPA: hypothetical protein VIT92_14990 [Burkholderiaceae bacterium]